MNDIVFIKGEGGLERIADGEDHRSAIIFYGAMLGGYSGTNEIFSVAQAEDLGIVNSGASAVWHYHISEFFRVQPNSSLWVGGYARPIGAYTFDDLLTLQRLSGGVIRQVAVFTDDDFDTTMVSALHAKALQLYNEHQPLVCLLAANVVDVTALADLRPLSSSYVSVVVGQDGGATGKALYDATGKSVTCLGATLGAVSRARVHENIGWVEVFNMVSGAELESIGFADGYLWTELTPLEISALNDKGYIFLRRHTGISGSYFNDSYTATTETSDYATIENNRTIDKAVRNVRTAILPKLNSPIRVNRSNGQLTPDVVKFFENLAGKPLEDMEKAGEISAGDATIDPKQDILSTSKLKINLKIVPVGVGREFEVSIGFALRIG